MLITRSWFFTGLFFLLVGPFFLPKLFWVLSSRRTIGKVLFTGGVLDPIDGTRKYLVMQFPLCKDNIEFQSNLYFRWPEDTVVAVRYSRFDPYDARIDLPVCIWGDTLVNVLLPLGIWLVLLLTPNRFDPLVPWGAKVRLGGRWPWIRVTVRTATGHVARLLLVTALGPGLSCGVLAQAQPPKKDTAISRRDTAVLRQATVTARPVYVQKADRLIVNVDAMISQGGSNALELLGILPGVSVDPAGNIRFNGRGGVLVLSTTNAQFVESPLWMVFAGIQRKVLRDRGLVRLAAQDIFHTYEPKGHLTNIPLATASFRNYVDTRIMALIFNYGLTRGKTKRSHKADGADEEEGRIKN